MGNGTKKSQSALEFLATHIWSILVVMIVIGLLFWIGVFEGSNVYPRAPPGYCTVYRPNGPGSLQGINLAGPCNGELPRYVGQYGYNGFSTYVGYSNISIPIEYMPTITASNKQEVTLVAWIYPFKYEPYETAVMYGNLSVINLGDPMPNAIFINVNGIEAGNPSYCGNGGLSADLYTNDICIDANSIPINTWSFVAVEKNATSVNGYAVINGNVYETSQSLKNLPSSFTIYAHSYVLISAPWNGLITNVQLYNTSLSYNALYAQADEGIAGAPLNLQNLVGWWPLDGTFQDYSGNGNTGYPSNTGEVPGSFQNNYGIP